MGKSKAVRYFEEMTGEKFEPEEPPQDRHLSVRLTPELASGLGKLAAERGQTMSQLVRTLITTAVDERERVAALDGPALADRLEADIAELRRRLPR